MQRMFFSFIVISSCADLSILEDDIEFAYQTWCADNVEGAVLSVYDGDTFDILIDGEEQRIRMLGVAAPEVESSDEPAECFGDDAGRFLRDLILEEDVRLEFDVECTDIYNRTLAWVVITGDDPKVLDWMQTYEILGAQDDGSYELLVNEMLVRLGYATVFSGELDQSVRYSTRMKDAEEAAEAALLGLWKECE